MNKTLIINLTGITQHVGVIHADGKKDEVQIMGRRRVELREGMSVDPSWQGRNIGCVRVVAPPVVSPVVTVPRRPPNEPLTVADVPQGSEEPRTIADLEAQSTEGEDE